MTDNLTARILDAWRIEKTTARHQGENFDYHTMAAIAADVAHRGQSWSAGDKIPTDINTIWIGPQLKATRSDDPYWWHINSEIQEDHLLEQLGPVYENQPTTTPDLTTIETPTNTASAPPPPAMTISGDDFHAARIALSNATATLEHLTDRRGHNVTTDLASRCAAHARACDTAYWQLTTKARAHGAPQ